MKIGPIPKNLSEAVSSLVATLSPADITFIKSNDAISQHHWMRRQIRNEWGLWEMESDLVQWFQKNLQLGHADDISSVILDSVWHQVTGEPFDLESKIAGYHDHWMSIGVDPVTQKKLG